MNTEVSTNPNEPEPSRRQARAVAQLSHPHIVGVIDAGEDDSRPYIVFGPVEGETLKARIPRMGRLPITEAVAYAIEITRALEAAHARHIVHRDVKPQNVLIDHEGSAKVTDFGIARTLEEAGLTADGRVLGTTDYVSPEQALGQDVTGQSDFYSLGVVLYEMLTGEVPFTGESQVAVAMKHVRETMPDVQVKRPEISAALASVVDTATAKRLDERYADDAELIADLEDVLAIEMARSGNVTGEVTTVLRTLPTRKRRRLPLRRRQPLLGGLLARIVAAAVVAVLVFAANNTHHGTGQLQQPPPKQTPHQVLLCDSCAHDYNPDALSGPKNQHPEQTGFAIDGDRNTAWSTESYDGDNLGKPGVGIYVDAKPGVAAGSMIVHTDTPGYAVTVYASSSRPNPNTFTSGSGGWVKVGGAAKVRKIQTIKLSTQKTRYRYYLVWITSLGAHSHVDVNEIALYT